MIVKLINIKTKLKKQKHIKLPLLILILLSQIVFISNNSVEASHIQQYVIAWSDVGPPHPFTGYPFGPIYTVASLMFDQLAWFGRDHIIPLLAEKWESSDGMRWIVKLKRNIKWHDGWDFTADDVVFSINYTKYVDNNIIPLWWARFTRDFVKDVKKIDNYTIEILLNTRIPEDLFINRMLAYQFIVPEHVWRKVHDPRNYTEPDAYIGTGPYRLIKYDRGREYVFEANENYYLGKPAVRILKLVVAPTAQLVAMMKRGEVHAASFSSYDDAQTLISDPSFDYITYDPGFVYVLVFNLNRYPFNQTAFREAIARAINYTEIFEKLGGEASGYMGEGPNIVPPYSPYYVRTTQDLYNISRAYELLESMGFKRVGQNILYPDGSRVSISLVVPTGDARAQTISILIRKYLEALGLGVEVRSIESGRRVDLLAKGDFDIMINFFGGMLTPYNAGFFERGSVHYIPGYNNSQLAQIMAKAQSSSYQDRINIMREFQEIFARDTPMIVLFWPKFYWVFNKQAGIAGWFFEPRYEYGPPWILNKLVLIEKIQATQTPQATVVTTPTMITSTLQRISPTVSETPAIQQQVVAIAIVIAVIAIAILLIQRLVRSRRG